MANDKFLLLFFFGVLCVLCFLARSSSIKYMRITKKFQTASSALFVKEPKVLFVVKFLVLPLAFFAFWRETLLVQITDKLQIDIKQQVRICCKNPYLLQSSIFSPFILEKCFTLFDTNVAFAASADAAMSISMLSSGFPDFSSVARISP